MLLGSPLMSAAAAPGAPGARGSCVTVAGLISSMECVETILTVFMTTRRGRTHVCAGQSNEQSFFFL